MRKAEVNLQVGGRAEVVEHFANGWPLASSILLDIRLLLCEFKHKLEDKKAALRN